MPVEAHSGRCTIGRRLPGWWPLTARCLSPCHNRVSRSRGTSRSAVGQLRRACPAPAGSEPQTELLSWTRRASPIRTSRRSATSRPAPTRRLSANRRPVSMNAIVKASDTASPSRDVAYRASSISRLCASRRDTAKSVALRFRLPPVRSNCLCPGRKVLLDFSSPTAQRR
jgi:hypothetical protein